MNQTYRPRGSHALFLLVSTLTLGCTSLDGALAPVPPNEPNPSVSAGVEGTGYDDGFFLRSADGRNELVVEGLFQTLASVSESGRHPRADVVLKRMRPELSGHIDDFLRFKLEPNFHEDDVELEEAWIGFEFLGGDALAMVGRMKAPFNLEEVRSRRHIDFSRFSVINQFAPAEDHGVFVNGRSPSGRLEYGVAVYNGTGTSDTNSGKDVAGRLMFHPGGNDEASRFHNLQLGLAGTFGNQDEPVGGESIENGLGFPVVTFAPTVELDGARWRSGVEAAWFRGPWFVQGELLVMSQEMSLGAADADVAFNGGYLTLSRVLTGEKKTFGGASPKRPFDFRTGTGFGAWVLAARISELHIDDDLTGFATPGTFTDRIRTASLGLNWVANDHMILRNALVYSRYDDTVALGTRRDRDELGAMFELQLHF